LNKYGGDIIFRITKAESGELVALAKSGFVFYNFLAAKVTPMPEDFRLRSPGVNQIEGSLNRADPTESRVPSGMKKPGKMNGKHVGQNRLTDFHLGFYISFYATVHGAAIVSAVVSNRTGLTVAHSVNAGSFNTFVDQSLTYGVRTTLGQILVVGVGTDGVGVAFNSGGDRRVGT